VEKRHLKTKLAEFKESKSELREIMDEADEQIEIWDTLKDDVEDGRIAYDPGSENGRKRKRGPSEKKSNKRRQGSRSGDSDFQDESEAESIASEDSEDSENSSDQSTRKPLTIEEINAKVSELRDKKKAARRQCAELDRRIHTAKDDLEKIEVETDEVKREMSALCIAGRNAYSKGAIQRDFASGIV
jgi:chromosome segregation ATPase